MLPKMLGLALVLLATLLTGMAVGMLVQLLAGGVEIAFGEYLRWYLLPGAVDALLIAVLAVFVQALSPSKYAGWGVMVLYIVILFFGPGLGLDHPLFLYGSVPSVFLSDMIGSGCHFLLFNSRRSMLGASCLTRIFVSKSSPAFMPSVSWPGRA